MPGYLCEFPHFKDLEKLLPRAELHVHTDQTDGSSAVREIFEAAHLKQLEILAFTEHVRRDSSWFGAFAEEVRREAKSFPAVRTLVGCEAKALDYEGTLDLSAEILDKSDLVLGSVHRFPPKGGVKVDITTYRMEEAAEMECRLALGLLENDLVDVLAHPGGMVLKLFGSFPGPLFEEILKKARDNHKAVEINSAYLDSPEKMEQFLALCRQINPRVSIGSDVHSSDDVGRCYEILNALLDL